MQPSGVPGFTGQANPGYGMNADLQTSANIDDDWRARFRQWVDLHKRYPRDAQGLGHQGLVTVRFSVALDGTVTQVDMLRPNGSPYLNQNLINLFRGATKRSETQDHRLPPLPARADPSGETITFTMHYILYRRF